MPMFNVIFKKLRKESGLSQQEFAEKINMSKSSVNMYERGEREPGLETLEAIADFFNVDMDYLLGKQPFKRKLKILSTNALLIPEKENAENTATINYNGEIIFKKLSPEDCEMLIQILTRLPDANESTTFNFSNNSKRLELSPEQQQKQ